MTYPTTILRGVSTIIHWVFYISVENQGCQTPYHNGSDKYPGFDLEKEECRATNTAQDDKDCVAQSKKIFSHKY